MWLLKGTLYEDIYIFVVIILKHNHSLVSSINMVDKGVQVLDNCNCFVD